MYIPNAFRIDDRSALHGFIRQYSFATMVTTGDEPFVTHIPLLLDPERGPHGTLVGHVARGNPHWQLDHAKQASVAIFHGPHAYVSPSWYRSGSPAVPTWNYAAVHALGHLSIITDTDRVMALLDRTTEAYESPRPNPWKADPEFQAKLSQGIVAFEMVIDRLEGKFKLSQNREPVDQIGAIEGLESTDSVDATATAKLMRVHLGLPRAE